METDSTAASTSSAASSGLEKGNRKLPSQRYLLCSRRSQLLFWQGNFSLLGQRNALSAWNKRALEHFCSLPLSTQQHCYQQATQLTCRGKPESCSHSTVIFSMSCEPLLSIALP